jgi:cytochrome P450
VTSTTEIYYDPYDYAIDADPYPIWRRMRDEAPVYHNERHDFYALTRYDDVLQGLTDHGAFLSSHGIVIESISDADFGIPMLIMMDPPTHTQLRKLVSRAFTPRTISNLEPRIRSICAGWLDPLVGVDRFDYIDQFAGLLPPTVILALLGFPDGYAAQFRDTVDSAFHLEEGEESMGGSFAEAKRQDGVTTVMALGSEVFEMLPELMEARRREPEDDLISGLVHSEIEDDGTLRKLTEEEIFAFVHLLSLAGTETVARMLGFAAVTLAAFPGERELLVENPAIIPNAIEELLRFEAPSPIQGRWASRDVEFHGTVIPRGATVALLNGSADRDERHFENPDRFDARRVMDRHLGLGYGAHYCIGAALARLEARIAVEETLRRFPTWDIADDGLERVHTSTVRGYTSVPMLPR